MKSRAKERGHTLVEVLIAVTLLAAIAAALAPATFAAIRASGRIAANAAALEEMRVGRRALEEILASMIIPDADDVPLQGTPDRLQASVLTSLTRGPEPAELKIRSGALIYVSLSNAAAPAQDVVLLRNVASLRYYGRADNDAAPQWTDRWDEREPPSLIAVAFRDGEDGDARQPLDFALSASAPLQCAFDQVSRQCRR